MYQALRFCLAVLGRSGVETNASRVGWGARDGGSNSRAPAPWAARNAAQSPAHMITVALSSVPALIRGLRQSRGRFDHCLPGGGRGQDLVGLKGGEQSIAGQHQGVGGLKPHLAEVGQCSLEAEGPLDHIALRMCEGLALGDDTLGDQSAHHRVIGRHALRLVRTQVIRATIADVCHPGAVLPD